MRPPGRPRCASRRSEEHTSELQSQFHLVCRLLLEKKKTNGSALRRASGEVGRRCRGGGLVSWMRDFSSSLLFFNNTATTEIYTLTLHDALPISSPRRRRRAAGSSPTRRSGAAGCRG